MSIVSALAHLPCAHGGPAGSARIRALPEDFVVREWLGFEADGEGDHLLLKVRKRGANTMWVAKQLARLGKIHPRDVGFAGLKDRDAVTEQSFTVPTRSAIGLEWVGVTGDGFEVLAAERQRRKLKRGALKGNDFELVLRDFTGDAALLERRLQSIAEQGVPNYFGPQRFGRGGNNLQVALAWFTDNVPPADRVQRGFALSAARAAIFNAVLGERVGGGTWNRLQSGEIVNLNGSGSIFTADVIDDTLIERCQRLDIHPTGPMWGKGEVVSAAERKVAESHPALTAGLASAGLEIERRALRAPVANLHWTLSGSDIVLRFRLQRGSFATAVLHELLEGAFATEAPEMDEI